MNLKSRVERLSATIPRRIIEPAAFLALPSEAKDRIAAKAAQGWTDEELANTINELRRRYEQHQESTGAA